MEEDNLYEEIVDLDRTFYLWLLPRLICFRKHNTSFPVKYENSESWNKEIDRVINVLKDVVNATEETSMKELEEKTNFILRWFCENLTHLNI